MITYYHKRALEHDLVYQKPERQENLQFIHQHLKASFKEKDILDVGCGTGYWSETIAASARSIYGIDINPSVLTLAENRQYACPTVQFEVLDYHQLHRIPQLFTGLFCGFVWSHILKNALPLFVDQLLSKLNEGDSIIIVDNQFVAGSSTPISRTDKMGNSYQNRILSNGESFEVLKNFPSSAELIALFKNRVQAYELIELDYFWMLHATK